jgi:hypothetical protein
MLKLLTYPSKHEETGNLLVQHIFASFRNDVPSVKNRWPVKKRQHWASIICQQLAISGATVGQQWATAGRLLANK